jgi:hypothetical protein
MAMEGPEAEELCEAENGCQANMIDMIEVS